ncbi:MAG TPA: hypothetical protein EYP08_07860, partial [Pyrodictiaceae archaeon]|nr:hypothetical protein [Pyrodictiaceae archaeon]
MNYEGKIILDDGSEVYHASDIPKDATIVDVEGVVVLRDASEINKVLDHLPDKFYVVSQAALFRWALKLGITPKTVEEE